MFLPQLYPLSLSSLDPFGERISLAVSTQSFFEEEEVKLERGAEAGCCERPSVFPRGRHELRGSGIIAPQGVVDIIQGLSTAFAVSGLPKGLSFGFRPKVSVLVGAEMFRKNQHFGRNYPCFGQN